MQQKLSKTPAKKLAKTQQNARFLDVFTHARARQCMVQKIGRGGNEGGEGKEEKEEEEEEEKEEDEEEDEEEDKEDEEDEEDEQEEEDEAKRREEGRGGGSLSKISSEETLSKLRLKLNQNKAKSTKHAGRPAEFQQSSNAIFVAKKRLPPVFVGNAKREPSDAPGGLCGLAAAPGQAVVSRSGQFHFLVQVVAKLRQFVEKYGLMPGNSLKLCVVFIFCLIVKYWVSLVNLDQRVLVVVDLIHTFLSEFGLCEHILILETKLPSSSHKLKR